MMTAALLTCARCGAKYRDDRAGWRGHRAVFGHAPEPPP